MADVKWIKITTDVFDDEKILLLENLPEADSIIVIWFKLLCLAGKMNNNGVFTMSNRIAYTDKMLATIFRRREATVQLALQTFEQFGMIEVIDGVITIPNWEKHQNIEGMEKIREQTRKRVAKYREGKKQQLIGLTNKCVYCGGFGDTVDHIIPRANGGLDIPANTVCSCLACNMQKNNHDVAKFLNDRLLLGEPVDVESITTNNVLSKYIRFDYPSNKFVTLQVTQCNATDKIREDKNRLDNNIICDSDESQPPKKAKHKYGEYNNVLLTDEEYQKLSAEYSDLAERIERLSSYVASTGKKYKSHYATIRNWARKDAETKPVHKWMPKNQNSYDFDDLEKALLET